MSRDRDMQIGIMLFSLYHFHMLHQIKKHLCVKLQVLLPRDKLHFKHHPGSQHGHLTDDLHVCLFRDLGFL